MLAHLRDNTSLSQSDIERAAQGMYLRKAAQDQALQTLVDLGLISIWMAKRGARHRKNLFSEPLTVGK